MIHINKLTTMVCTAALALLALTGCEGGDLYNVDTPDWVSEKIDSINNAKNNTEEEPLVGMQEDVYSFGATDFSSGFWQSFSKYYVVGDGQKWNAVFNLNLNPSDNTYYKNFALIITNDADRGDANYKEYGAFRFDATGDSAKYNSQWGSHLYFKYTESSLMLSPDASNTDANVQKLGGKVTLTVDRSQADKFVIKLTNGTATKTYTQPYAMANLNEDATNTNLRCFICVEGSYIDFLQTNIVPIGGLTSAQDKAPLSMQLMNVPTDVDQGTDLDEAMSNVSAVVTFEEGVTKTVPASELYFSAVPDMDKVGEKTLVAIYNKTFKGETAAKPIVASAAFNVVERITKIAVTTQPTHNHYYFYASAATSGLSDRTLAFDPTGMVVDATYANGDVKTIDLGKLSFSSVPAKAGTHKVTISTDNGETTTVNITVSASTAAKATISPEVLGPTDNSGAWWSVHTENVKVPAGATRYATFTNYGSMANAWNNFVVVLRGADNVTEYAVVRADAYGWGNGYASAIKSPAPADIDAWKTAMNGAKVTLYVTNCNNGTADVQAVINGTDGQTYTLYYLGLSTVAIDNLYFAFTIDSCHLVFDNTANARRHTLRR